MIELLIHLFHVTLDTVVDVLPIVIIIFGFQFLVIRKPVPNLGKVIVGFIYVLIGLAFFLVGLQEALFPLGELMAQQLTDPDFIYGTGQIAEIVHWQDYKWVYLFAIAIGFATTIAEPSLLAVAIKANEVSAGVIGINGLRIAVAVGVAVGLGIGTFRIVTGTPLHYYIVTGYFIVIIQTFYAPKMIIALAYDSGGPGRSAVLDGFGLIAFASLCPIISVMTYAQLSEWRGRRNGSKKHSKDKKEGGS